MLSYANLWNSMGFVVRCALYMNQQKAADPLEFHKPWKINSVTLRDPIRMTNNIFARKQNINWTLSIHLWISAVSMNFAATAGNLDMQI